MNMSIEKMLSHVYEIEGLMLVTRRLGEENTPQVITNKIQRKVRELAEMCGVAFPEPVAQPAPAEEAPAVAQPAPVEEAPAVAQPADEEAPVEEAPAVAQPADEEVPAEDNVLPEEDYDADETWQHDNGEEFKEVFELNYEEPQHATTPPPFNIAQDTTAAPAAPASEAAAASPAVDDYNAQPLPEPDPDVLPEAEDGPDIEVEFIEAEDDTVLEPEEEMPIPPVPTDFPEVEEPSAPLRVDEKLQRHLSKDIRKAISLNDRFRFQRELFAGSANAMDTAIEHIEVMTSYGNAELYFYSQLNWDRENEVVKDFMAIVRNHFQK
jgi:hypothetical protein